MDRQPVLESERLLLRPLVPDDWAALFAIASDRELWAQHPASDRWQEPVFRTFFDEALANGGALTCIDKSTAKVVASSQFRPCPIAPDEMEIGWTFLARQHWGGGLNAEMKRLMLSHALASVPQVLFRIGKTNWRSRRALEKIGGELTEMVEDGRIANVVYRITRESFYSGPLS